ncbi:MAG: AAA family ATPase [Caulobacteraceae bacterium]
MRTLAVLASKGGTGKSTVSVHLACAAQAAGKRTLLADLDSQQSALDWKRVRGARAPSVAEARLGTLFMVRESAIHANADLFIIDTRPTVEADTLEAVRLADLCLVVVRPSAIDLRAIVRTVELIDRQRKRAIFMINQAPHRRAGHENPAVLNAAETLRRMGLEVANTGLRARSAYQQAMAVGLTAQELEPDSTAAAEINALWTQMALELWPPQQTEILPFKPKPMFQRAPVQRPQPPQDFPIRPAG